MNFSLYIARRYLFSKKSRNVINLITGIAMVGIAVGTAALIIVLSVFNGLNSFIEEIYAAMDPDLKVVPVSGKFLPDDEQIFQLLTDHPDIMTFSRTIEGKVGIQYKDIQSFAVLKGVEPNFKTVNYLADSAIFEGEYTFEPDQGIPQVLMGWAVKDRIRARVQDREQPLRLMTLSQERKRLAGNLLSNAKSEFVFPAGFFSVQKEYDEQYILADFEFARNFLEYDAQLSSYEIRLHDPDKDQAVAQALRKVLPSESYEVQTWNEQHPSLYRVMRSEKFISYLILSLIIALAAINILGSLSMIVLEKTADIAILQSMGATPVQIRRIFLLEGVLVGGIGVGAGMLIGFVVGFLQENYGLIKLGSSGEFRVQAYPLEMQGADFLLIFATVMVFTLLASIYPSQKSTQFNLIESLHR